MQLRPNFPNFENSMKTCFENIKFSVSRGESQRIRLLKLLSIGALRRPAWLPAPSLALKIAMGELSEIGLASQRVMPQKALQAGYVFKFPSIDQALNDLFASRRSLHTREENKCNSQS